MLFSKMGRLAAIAAAALISGTLSGHAAIIGFDFEDLQNNGANQYQSQDFTFAPTNFASSQHCYPDETDPNPRHCFLEFQQGEPTTLTEDADDGFDMLGFYFNFQGTAPNSLVVTDTVSETIALGQSYDGTGNFSIFDLGGSLVTGALQQQTGYWVLFNNDHYDNISKFTWDAQDNKQIRVDCVIVDGTANGQNLSGSDLASSCVPNTTPIPIPAAGLLLIGGLAGLGALGGLRRRHRTTD